TLRSKLVVGGVSLLVLACALQAGCRRFAPIYTWQPPQVAAPPQAQVALAPIAGNGELARRIEQALLAQRPAARADVALFTAQQLAAGAPIRLVSTAPLTSELSAIHAARTLGADILLQGEILASNIELDSAEPEPQQKNINMNQAFFKRTDSQDTSNESLLLSWRVIDVASGRTLGSQGFTLHAQQAADQYPDLALLQSTPSELLIAASARETWKTISPYVAQDRVELAVPWLQPGAWRVRRGVAAARKGDWQLAEQHWSRVVNNFSFNAAAQHNLALAEAAREDFPAAKLRLQKARGLLAFRLPAETLFWIDQNHRLYNQAHGLGKPEEGWAFPEPTINQDDVHDVTPVDIASLPWWTAIPFAKPPGWTWHAWLRQPWVFY
ncbi:MAG: hypothetical protein KDA45_09650, partial [Planctomycetales bacterium]|nr:hypothetical protein [Planctomycetales bacterium]